MTVDETAVYIEGYQDELTKYTLRLDDLKHDNGEATATVSAKREGDSAIVEDAEVTVRSGGSEVDYSGEFPNAPENFSEGTLTFPADPGDTVEIEWLSTSWGDNSGTLSGELPDEPDVSVGDCSVSTDRVVVGEPVTLSATVQNGGGAGEFVATLSDQDGEIESETFEIDADGSRDIEFEVTYDTPNTDGYDLSVDVSEK